MKPIWCLILPFLIISGVSRAGGVDVDPSVIVHSCRDAWCKPVVDAYEACVAGGGSNCEQDERVKDAHIRALGRTTPSEIAANEATRSTRLAGKTTFMGYAIGMTLLDVQSVLGTQCRPDGASCHRRSDGRFIFVEMHGGQLATVSISTSGDRDFLEVVDMLTEKYGKPALRRASVVTNAMGAKFDKLEFAWHQGDAVITAANIAEKIGEGLVVFSDPTVTAADARDRQQRRTFVREHPCPATCKYVKTGQIDFGLVETADEFITESGLTNSSARMIPAGTILMAMYGQGVTRGKVGVLGIDAAINQACAAILPKSTDVLGRLDRDYLFHAFAGKYEKLRAISEDRGGNQSILTTQLIRDTKISLPALDTQRAIVAEIEAEQALVNANKQLIERFEAKIKAAIDRVWGTA